MSLSLPDGKATTLKKVFSRQTSVGIAIHANQDRVWSLLTHASDFPRWNSTVLSIEGSIAPGQTIALTSSLDPKRIFKLNIIIFEPNKRLVWGDRMGKRIFTLTSEGPQTIFQMSETIGGPLFPLFARMIPSFNDAFEQFAQDLKKEAESTPST